MGNLNFKKIIAAFLLIFSALNLSSCDGGSGCVTAEEFDSKSVKVDANPVSDGIFGNYDDQNGGQVANWHETGLRTANEDFIILVSGEWIPWKGQSMNSTRLTQLPECDMCAKRENSATQNCICYQHKTLVDYPGGKEPKPEITPSGKPASGVDCTGPDQDDPTKCTCTTNNGRADEYGIFHFPLNYYTKNQVRKNPDDQTGICKYNRGLGLYLGVFGRSGSETPLRLYHLFSEEEICAVRRNSLGQCVDDHGNSRLKYVFRSANQRNFMKDDQDGNSGFDANTGNDIYHGANEYVKLIIQDSYYSDNYGHYNVEFVKGVLDDSDVGLLEFMVRLIEDELLGELNPDGTRDGGILKFMYNSIARDYGFLRMFQVALFLYVSFFGLSSLLGLVELNKKEIYGRVLKVSVVIFLTNPDSWQWYRIIVVGFFYDGLNAAIDIIMSLANVNLDESTNPMLIAQLGSSTPGSTGSRFAYVDVMLRILFSDNVTKKIWGLFFESFFGLIYISGIYALIFYFLYTMLIAASVYAVTLTKMIFALALGPIFIAFSLFKQTNEIFKKWIGFVGARSLEMLILFLLLYTLISLVNERFTELLSYPVCFEGFSLGFFSIKVLVAQPDRNLLEWLSMLTVLGLFIYMTNAIMEQIPSLAGSLISIGGTGNQSAATKESYASSGFKLGQSMAGGLFDLSKGAAGLGMKYGVGNSARALRNLSRKTGLSAKIDSAFNKIPFRGPRTLIRDAYIDSAIKKAKQSGKAKGLKGADLDKHIRNAVLFDKDIGVRTFKYGSKKGADYLGDKKDKRYKNALLDMSTTKVLERLDQKLTKEPLKKFLKGKAKELKKQDGSDIPLGKDMNKALKENARNWAEENLHGGAKSVEGHLHDLKKFMTKTGGFSTKEAAKKFGGDDESSAKYLQYLKQKRFEKYGDNAKKAKLFSKAEKKFATEQHNRDKSALDNSRKGQIKTIDEHIKRRAELAGLSADRDYLLGDKFAKEKQKTKDHYDNKIKNESSEFQKRKIGKKRDEAMRAIDEKREFYKRNLRDQITARAQDIPVSKRAEAFEKAEEFLSKVKQDHMKHIEDLAGNDDWKKIIAKNGGKENYRDGLVSLGEASVFEAQAWRDALEESRDGAGSSGDANSDAFEKAMNQTQETNVALAELDKVISDMEAAKENGAAPQEVAEIEEKFKAVSAIPQEVDLQFGASINQALGIQASDVGLKESSPLLGIDNSGKLAENQDFAMLNSFESSKFQSELKMRSKKFEKAGKEYELNSLDPEKDKAKIDSLTNEIKAIEKDISASEKEISSISEQINSVKSGNY